MGSTFSNFIIQKVPDIQRKNLRRKRFYSSKGASWRTLSWLTFLKTCHWKHLRTSWATPHLLFFEWKESVHLLFFEWKEISAFYDHATLLSLFVLVGPHKGCSGWKNEGLDLNLGVLVAFLCVYVLAMVGWSFTLFVCSKCPSNLKKCGLNRTRSKMSLSPNSFARSSVRMSRTIDLSIVFWN